MHNIQAKHTTVPNNPNRHASRGVIQAQELLQENLRHMFCSQPVESGPKREVLAKMTSAQTAAVIADG